MSLDNVYDYGNCPICKPRSKETCPACAARRRNKLIAKGFELDEIFIYPRPVGGGYAVTVNGTPVAWFGEEDDAKCAKKSWQSNWSAVAGRTLAVVKG